MSLRRDCSPRRVESVDFAQGYDRSSLLRLFLDGGKGAKKIERYIFGRLSLDLDLSTGSFRQRIDAVCCSVMTTYTFPALEEKSSVERDNRTHASADPALFNGALQELPDAAAAAVLDALHSHPGRYVPLERLSLV